jgi:hypothetical protein
VGQAADLSDPELSLVKGTISALATPERSGVFERLKAAKSHCIVQNRMVARHGR